MRESGLKKEKRVGRSANPRVASRCSSVINLHSDAPQLR